MSGAGVQVWKQVHSQVTGPGAGFCTWGEGREAGDVGEVGPGGEGEARGHRGEEGADQVLGQVQVRA